MTLARSGEEAIGILRAQTVHVVCTDYQMPGMDGRRAAREWPRSWPRVRRRPGDGVSRARGAARCDRDQHLLVVKPFAPERLLSVVPRRSRFSKIRSIQVKPDSRELEEPCALTALLHNAGSIGTLTLAVARGVSSGTAALWRYSMTPGESAALRPRSGRRARRSHWPKDAHTLVMLVHPRCSCTRASMAELAKIMTRLEGAAKAYVMFMKPADSPRTGRRRISGDAPRRFPASRRSWTKGAARPRASAPGPPDRSWRLRRIRAPDLLRRHHGRPCARRRQRRREPVGLARDERTRRFGPFVGLRLRAGRSGRLAQLRGMER